MNKEIPYLRLTTYGMRLQQKLAMSIFRHLRTPERFIGSQPEAFPSLRLHSGTHVLLARVKEMSSFITISKPDNKTEIITGELFERSCKILYEVKIVNYLN